MENPLKNSQIEKLELLNLLTKYKIPIDTWGIGEAKTVEHLVGEINAGETVLTEDKDTGKLIREFSFVAITVLYKGEEHTYQLVEEKQVFADGRERVRSLDASVGEKIKHGESDTDEIIKRALEEELGIQKGFSIGESDCVKEEVDSKSYPGLMSRRKRLNVVTEIDSTQYKPEGYKEVQSDKTTYFVWKEV